MVYLHDHEHLDVDREADLRIEGAQPLGFNGLAFQGFELAAGGYVTFCPECRKPEKEWRSEQEFLRALKRAAKRRGRLYSALPDATASLTAPHLEAEDAHLAPLMRNQARWVASRIVARHAEREPMCTKGE
jgi:hypothetical protein